MFDTCLILYACSLRLMTMAPPRFVIKWMGDRYRINYHDDSIYGANVKTFKSKIHDGGLKAVYKLRHYKSWPSSHTLFS